MSSSSSSSGGLRPLLPTVCQSQNFVLASQTQIQEYAASSVVAQLLQALEAWISHCDQVFENLQTFFRSIDEDCHSVSVHVSLIVDIAEALRRSELETSFYSHFASDEVLAVRRVLDCVPSQSAEKLKILDGKLKTMEIENKKLARSKELFSLLDSYCNEESSWNLMNCDDTLPPLFCALRAVFICCPLFGKENPERFSVLVRCILKRVEFLIYSTVPPLLNVQSLSLRNGVEDAMDACLAAQGACICLQEEFYKLRISVADAVSKEFIAVLYQGIDETNIFTQLEFFYDRCVILLHLLTVLKQRKEELLVSSSASSSSSNGNNIVSGSGGSIAEKILSFELMSRKLSHEDVIDAIRSLSEAPSMKPKDIIARIEAKSKDYHESQLKKQQTAIMSGSGTANSEVQYGVVVPPELHMMNKTSAAAAAAVSGGDTESNIATSSSSRKSRVATENEASHREWSLQYGEQQQAVTNAATATTGSNRRAPYYSICVSFNPPRIQLAGIPLSHRQLETVAIKFQDALRTRVSHTAASIRQDRLDAAAISIVSAVLKAPYEKFRSASDELADARYEAHDRSFHKVHKKDDAASMEAELMQLRRYHVAAANNAHTLELPGVTTEEDEVQSYAVNILLEALEAIDGEDAEMATTNAFTDNDGMYHSYFVFRYLPSMPRSRRRRAE